jgi:8-oxo-dGTP diphosphatase
MSYPHLVRREFTPVGEVFFMEVEQIRTSSIRQKVVCYITRGRREILVFRHSDQYPEAGVQVVAGGIEPGESAEAAAVREAFEEAGLVLNNPRLVGALAREVNDPHKPYTQEHCQFYWLEAPETTPDAWVQRAVMEAADSPDGYDFYQQFEPLGDHKIEWGMDVFLPELLYAMEVPITERVVCYVSRGQQLLTLSGHPDGGLQVVKGGREAHEKLVRVAKRELREEAGLVVSSEPLFLGTQLYQLPPPHRKAGEFEQRHYYWFSVSDEVDDEWTHQVTAGEDDQGLVFEHRFVELGELTLDWDLGYFLPQLQLHLMENANKE